MPAPDSMGVLRALYETAASEGRPVNWLSSAELALTLEVVSPDGLKTTFELAVTIKDDRLQFKESQPIILPASCPNRHINSDGTFCLTAPWCRDELMTNPLALVQKFLRLQLSAARNQKWPAKSEWSHGDAAKFQKDAEEAAARLSPEWHQLMVRKKLRLRRRGNFLSVSGSQKRVSIWIKEGRVATLRQRCFCGQSNCTVSECSSHANDAVEMVRAISLVERAEAEFWQARSGQSCCGSMTTCPLKTKVNPNE